MIGIKLFADKKEQEKRYEICSKCEHKKEKWLVIFNEESCGICKCSIPKKIKFKHSKCPKSKWN